MPITWNAEAEARLLLGILDQLKGHRLDYKALAAYMGPGVTTVKTPSRRSLLTALGCTVPALQQRLFKLRREAGIAGSARGQPAGSSPSTPSLSKRSKRPLSPKLPSPIEKVKKGHYFSDDHDDGAEICDAKLIKDEEDEKKVIVDPV
ncbi:hypothetical protein BJY00DRAFT_277243, partial [Aspergillus carlsbadensis]